MSQDEMRPRSYKGKPAFDRSNKRATNYLGTVQAMCELIDNSIEANARNIGIIVVIDGRLGRGRQPIKSIHLVDDGDGMSRELLHSAVCENSGNKRQLGDGDNRRRKLGKYGVGLPLASSTQADLWDVLTWTESEGAWVCGIDWNDVEFQNTLMVHPPERAEIPTPLLEAFGLTEATSGSVVSWWELDHVVCNWRTTRGLVGNVTRELGRVYRKLLEQEDDAIEIKMAIMDSRDNFSEPELISINDPLYLTPGTPVLGPDYLDNWDTGTPLGVQFAIEGAPEGFLQVLVPNEATGELTEDIIHVRASTVATNIELWSTVGSLVRGHGVRRLVETKGFPSFGREEKSC